MPDVCKNLDLSNPSAVKQRLDIDGTQLIDLQDLNLDEGVIINKLQNTKTTFINEPNLYRCIFQSKKKEAKKFQDWIFEEVIPSIRKTGKYEKESSDRNPVLDRVNIAYSSVEWAKKLLRLSDASTALLFNRTSDKLERETGCRSLARIDYVESKGQMLSATELLKRNNIGVSAIKFNKLMIEKGYMEILSRPSKSKMEKLFNSLTEAGKAFGDNKVSPKNENETQPLYYVDKFRSLLKELNIID